MKIKFKEDLNEWEIKFIDLLNTAKNKEALEYYNQNTSHFGDMNFSYVTEFSSTTNKELYVREYYYYFLTPDVDINTFKGLFNIFDKQFYLGENPLISRQDIIDAKPDSGSFIYREKPIMLFSSLYQKYREYLHPAGPMYKYKKLTDNEYTENYNAISQFLTEQGYKIRKEEFLDFKNSYSRYYFDIQAIDYVMTLVPAHEKTEVMSKFLYYELSSKESVTDVLSNIEKMKEGETTHYSTYDISEMKKSVVRFEENIQHMKHNYSMFIDVNFMKECVGKYSFSYLHLLFKEENYEECKKIIKDESVITKDERKFLLGIFKSFIKENSAQKRKEQEAIFKMLLLKGMDLSVKEKFISYSGRGHETILETIHHEFFKNSYSLSNKREINRANKINKMLEDLLPLTEKFLIEKEIKKLNANLIISPTSKKSVRL